jgi:superfamily II DNA or RNA helicase
VIKLRDYQQECIDTISEKGQGRYLIQMATGLGKTVTFANINRQGRMLILSHREELVKQPLKYFNCTKGVEMSKERSNGEEVISASVQSMTHRLDRFNEEDFDIIVVDEAHHAAAKSYKKVIEHFKPRQLLGFTATPNRADKARLNDVFDEIIFKRDLRWGIKNGYLCDVLCKRCYIGYDLSAVHTRLGDYAPGELEKAMDGTADAIAEAYRKHANGATLIFAVSVEQCNEIAKRIPGAEVVTGSTKNRSEIIQKFTNREIPCLVNCMVFTEGTDIPLVETVIIARPTQSDSLYTQMVGRGLRLYPSKDKLTLIDCVGVTGKASLCTAPSLLGIDISDIPQARQDEVQGMLFELPEKAEAASDCPQSWIKNTQIVDLWAQEQKYNTHDVNWFKKPNGDLVCSLPDRQKLVIPCQNELGMTIFEGHEIDMQEALDKAYEVLQTCYRDNKYIWDLKIVKKWGKSPATEKQIQLIKRKGKKVFSQSDFDLDNLTKMQASQILNRLVG